MAALWIDGLCKRYPGFYLDHVSFEVGEGRIMGFIGRNGAGKTTTLKAIFNYVHPDGGAVYLFGLPFDRNEAEIKSRVGYVGSDGGFYTQKRLAGVTEVTRSFYPNWDDGIYRACLKRFSLDDSKCVRELSEGMKVKYQLALALSHHAQLLVLDEPTSGLDPVSRDDLLELLRDLAEHDGVSILFSTHITADLEKCADEVTYIQNGKIRFSGRAKELTERYVLVSGSEAALSEADRSALIGCRVHRGEFSAMAPKANALGKFTITAPTLEDVMVFLERT